MLVAEYCGNCDKRTLRKVGQCPECTPENVESQTTDTQHLKAEISAMISKWKHCCELGVDWYEVEISDYERLQKLSAV